MPRSKKQQIIKILEQSQVPESLKQSFLRAYSAVHKNTKRQLKSCGGE